MNSEEIEKFLTEKTTATEIYVKIDFKKKGYNLWVICKRQGLWGSEIQKLLEDSNPNTF